MPDNAVTLKPERRCCHIFPSGHRCASPSLRGERFCYYHHASRPPAPRRRLQSTEDEIDFSPLEDRQGLQLTLAEVLRRIANGTLDPRRGGLLLYGLQIASGNLPRPRPDPDELEETVTVLEVHEEHGPIAPDKPHLDPPILPRDQIRELFARRIAEKLAARPPAKPADHPAPPSPALDHTQRELAQHGRATALSANPTPVDSHRVPACSGVLDLQGSAARTHTAPPTHASVAEAHPQTQKSPPRLGWASPRLCRRSPNLPHTFACSTIGPTRLNFRVRDGNGCDPRGKLTGNFSNVAPSRSFTTE